MVYAPLRINTRKSVVKLSAMAPKNAAAVTLGRRGGKATAEKRTPEQRSEAARKAVQARWAKSMKRIDASLKRTEKNLATIAKMKANAPKLRKFVDGITVGTKALEKLATKKAKQKKSPPPEE